MYVHHHERHSLFDYSNIDASICMDQTVSQTGEFAESPSEIYVYESNLPKCFYDFSVCFRNSTALLCKNYTAYVDNGLSNDLNDTFDC